MLKMYVPVLKVSSAHESAKASFLQFPNDWTVYQHACACTGTGTVTQAKQALSQLREGLTNAGV